MFKHILVPIDGSGHALKAAEMAIELARLYGARLTLLHVTRKLEIPERLREYLKDEHLTGEPIYALDGATEKVIGEVKQDAERKGVHGVRTVFKEGKPARSIVEFADREHVDAIVMGSRGLTDIEGALLGSVSHKVSSLASCTVIVVK